MWPPLSCSSVLSFCPYAQRFRAPAHSFLFVVNLASWQDQNKAAALCLVARTCPQKVRYASKTVRQRSQQTTSGISWIYLRFFSVCTSCFLLVAPVLQRGYFCRHHIACRCQSISSIFFMCPHPTYWRNHKHKPQMLHNVRGALISIEKQAELLQRFDISKISLEKWGKSGAAHTPRRSHMANASSWICSTRDCFFRFQLCKNKVNCTISRIAKYNTHDQPLKWIVCMDSSFSQHLYG